MLINSSSIVLLAFVGYALGDAKKTSDIVQVDFSTDAHGGCSYVGETTMDGYIEDCLTLAKAGVELMDDYQSKGEASPARRLADSLFKAGTTAGENANVVTNARANFEAIANFLEGKNKLGDKLPLLFCQSTWLEAKTMDDTWIDEHGLDEHEEDSNGNPLPQLLRNRDIQYMIDTQANAEAGSIPYFSSIHSDWIFDGQYSNPGIGYCSDDGNLGATQQFILPPTVTVCPAAWQKSTRLRQQPIKSLLSADIKKSKTGITKLTDIMPTAATIFHELFHLVLGNDATTPSSGKEVYEWTVVRRLSAANTLRNPETYTFAAVAYDITMHDSYEFYAQYAVKD